MRVFASILFLLGTTSLLAQEELFLQPPGLEPGDQYRLLFVTSATRDATSTDIADYNDFVQQVAHAAPVVSSWGLSWSVVGSTEAVDARTNTGTDYGDGSDGYGVPVYRLDGVKLVPDYRGLWEPIDFPVSVPGGPNLTELGAVLEPEPDSIEVEAYTGTTMFGVVDEGFHLGSVGSVSTGLVNAPENPEWFSRLSISSQAQLPFYAMSEVLTAIPEPSCSTMLFIGMVIAIARLRKRRCG